MLNKVTFDESTHPRIKALVPKLIQKTGCTEAQGINTANNFTLYFTPRWGVDTDRKLLNLMIQVLGFIL